MRYNSTNSSYFLSPLLTYILDYVFYPCYVSTMKAIILAAGKGTRLQSMLPNGLPKHLLTIGDCTLIERNIRLLIKHGIKDISIVTSLEGHRPTMDTLLALPCRGIKFTCLVDLDPKGIASSLYAAKQLRSKEGFIVLLADNIFEDIKLIHTEGGCTLSIKSVENASSFGVLKYNSIGLPSHIIEKPEAPRDREDVVLGCYIYPPDIFTKLRTLKPSARGEYEITDVNNLYLKEGRCKLVRLDGDWFDCGTPESVERARDWVRKNDSPHRQ